MKSPALLMSCVLLSGCAASPPAPKPKLGVLPVFDHLICAESIRAKVGDAECRRRLTAFIGRGLKATVVLRAAAPGNAPSPVVGAGVVIDAAGRVLTSYRAVRGLAAVSATVREVGGSDGRFVYRDARVVPLRLVAFSERPDLALLEPERPGGMPEPLPLDLTARSFRQDYRYWFFAASPTAFGGSIISGITESRRLDGGQELNDLVGLNVPSGAADLGGPVISYKGDLVGIMLFSDGASRTSYFVPAHIAAQIFGLPRADK